MSGIEVIRQIKEKFPEMTILMLSVYQEDDRIFHALCAGAVGYLLKKHRRPGFWRASAKRSGGAPPMSPELKNKTDNRPKAYSK